MGKIINTIIGNLDEKREYKENEARAKLLPAEYRTAYDEIKNYIWLNDNESVEITCRHARGSGC